MLAGCGMVARAARGGMSRQAAYRLRARAPQFAFLWDEALKVAAARRPPRGAGAGRCIRCSRVRPIRPKTGVTDRGATGEARGAAG